MILMNRKQIRIMLEAVDKYREDLKNERGHEDISTELAELHDVSWQLVEELQKIPY